MNRLLIGLTVAAHLWAGSAVVQAEEYALHQWKKTQLQDKFFCEGANAGDFNNDGKIDVVSGPYWYAGPDFKQAHEIYPPEAIDRNTYSKNFVAFADDVDGDSWADVVVIGFPGQESWWFRNPGGKDGHWEKFVIDDYVGNESPTYVDVNGDGRKEVVYINRRGQYGYASPDPSDPKKKWIFTAISPVANLHHFTHGMGVGDVNGDGRLDLLEKDGWWMQPPAGEAGFWKKYNVAFAGPGGAQMFAYDVDGDGDNDVITSLQAHAYGLAWYENVGKGDDGAIEFKQHIILKDKPEPNEYGIVFSQLHALDLVDVDNDGVLDVVTGKRHWAHNGHDPDERGPAVLYWFRIVRGPDGVQFVPHLIDDNSGVGTQVVATDITGDGLVDIVVGNKLGTFLNIHETKQVSKEEWEAAQPKATSAPRAEKGPAENDRLSGVVPKSADGRSLNLGFETGDLSDWKAEGAALTRQPIEGDSVARRRTDMASGHEGKFWLGTFEVLGDLPQGTLTSVPFRVTHPYASFLIAGGSYGETRVELVDADTNRFFFRVSGANIENLRPVLVDLKKWQGKDIYIRVVDAASGGWGHVNFDDFRFHATKPALVNELVPVKQNEFAHAGLSAEEAARAMDVPEGFAVDVVAAEPTLTQPIAMTIDERGRIWVVEGHTYPIRAPEGKGRDRVLIFADSDGDGKFDEPTVFAEGLNLVSGIEVGYGGVYLGAAPYLLFVPDRDRDDRPDGPPEILLDGWGYQDTHETLNSFIWGPDGWLYGCHGVFTHSRVGKPRTPDEERTPINAGIWRYHPIRKKFEVFAHGTSNPWGVDFNDQGQCFLTCCVIPHLFHVIDGARYQRQAGTHFNPYTFADIPTIAKHRHWVGPQPHAGNSISNSAGGGHAHAGCMVYLGGSWPAKYRNQLFMNNIHGARLNEDLLEPSGSGYFGDRAPDFLVTNDQASQILYLRSGPDGQLYMIDWYDMNQCHLVDPAKHDGSNGRLYRVRSGDLRPTSVDLTKASDMELVKYQFDANDWYVRTARRLLAERAQERALDRSAVNALRQMATTNEDETRRLRALWSLHAAGLADEEFLLGAMQDKSPYLRGFAIQFAFEKGDPSSSVQAKLVELAQSDPSPVVRLYLASAAQRLSVESRPILLSPLLGHAEDRTDHNLPLMYWYALEPVAGENPGIALKLADSSPIPILWEFVARRIALAPDSAGIDQVVQAIAATDSPERRRAFVRGLAQALEGRRKVNMPAGWRAVAAHLTESDDRAVVEMIRGLSAKFGDEAEMAELRAMLMDEKGDAAQRREALRTLVDVKDPEAAPLLQKLLEGSTLRGPALRGLAVYADPQTPERVLAVYPSLSLAERRDALALLSGRLEYARGLLGAVAEKKIPSTDLGADVIRQLRTFNSKDLDKQITDVWGIARDVSEDKQEVIARYRKLIKSGGSQDADLPLGRAVYARTCATCHELFGTGSDVGPALTGSNRRDLEYILSNVIDPSAVMAKEYQPYTVITVDGRVVTGILKAATDATVTLRTANEKVVLAKDDIDEMTLSPKSMMPEDQWNTLSDREVRALVAYLASPSQTPMRATRETASLIFNGVDRAGWRGNDKLWSVENGELVGRSEGLKHNEFLISDMLVGDFRLRVKVKLVPNGGNSGIQFRSEPIAGGEMKGYQADIGAGWWGKLYEEGGRGLLWDKSGESFVRPGEWNDYEILAVGHRVQTWINGQPCVDLTDPDGATEGVIAVQIHAGPAMEVRFKDFVLDVENLDESGSTAKELGSAR